MPTLPPELASILLAFCPLFSCRVWKSAHVLFIGAILAPGKRTVSSALRVMGLGDEQHFQNYHRVLNRAAWSCRKASLILVRMLVAAFAPEGPWCRSHATGPALPRMAYSRSVSPSKSFILRS